MNTEITGKVSEPPAREDYKRSLKLYEKLVCRLPGYVFKYKLLSTGEGYFTYISRANRTNAGIERLLMQDAERGTDFVYEDDRTKLFECIYTAFEDLSPVDFEFRVLSSGPDEVQWKRVQAVPEKMKNGSVIFYGYFSDINEQKIKEKKLLLDKETSEKANLAKSELLAKKGHEIRTPLNAMLGFSELLKGATTDPKHEKYIEGILSGGKNLLALINDLSDLAKTEKTNITVTNSPDCHESNGRKEGKIRSSVNFKLPDEIKDKLEKQFITQWNNVKELMSIDDIIEFSANVKQFALENDIDGLNTYATHLFNYADNFEIDLMNKEFNRFIEIVKK